MTFAVPERGAPFARRSGKHPCQALSDLLRRYREPHAAYVSEDTPEVPTEIAHSAHVAACSVTYLLDDTATDSDDAVLTFSASSTRHDPG